MVGFKKGWLLGTLLTVCPLAVSVSCDRMSPEGPAPASEGVLVKPSYNRNDVLKNPMTGWVMYGSATGSPSYWDTKFYNEELGKDVYVKDYASACYIRTGWCYFEPEDGVYAWRDPNSSLGKMIKGALDRGLPVAFRIVVDGRDQRRNTPKFVTDAGAKYWQSDPNHPEWVTPYPQDPVFQRYYERLISELAKDFDDPDKCAFVDAYGLGKWGEGHNVCYEYGNPVNERTETLKYEVMDWITDVYSRNFRNVPLLINYHRVIGHPTSDGAVNPNTEKLLNLCIGKGYSLRQDAFGMTDYYKSWEKGYVANWFYKRPCVMEGGWIVSSHRYWTDGSGKYREGHPEDVRQGEYEDSKGSKVNMMDFRVGEETKSWFNDAFDLVRKFVSEGGYRLYPDQITVIEEIANGQTFTLAHRWRNMGWGYFPNNIPQWNYRYKVAFALLDSKDAVRQLVVDPEVKPSEWVEGAVNMYKTDFKVDVPPGNYTWAVAIVNTAKNNVPGIKLAVKGDFSKDGWYKIKDVTVK